MHMYVYTPSNAVSKFTIEQTLKRLLMDFSGCSRTLNLSGKVGVVVVTYMHMYQHCWVMSSHNVIPHTVACRTSPNSISQSTWSSSRRWTSVGTTYRSFHQRWDISLASFLWCWMTTSWSSCLLTWNSWLVWSLSLSVITVSWHKSYHI